MTIYEEINPMIKKEETASVHEIIIRHSGESAWGTIYHASCREHGLDLNSTLKGVLEGVARHCEDSYDPKWARS